MESAGSSGDSELDDEKSQLVQRIAAPIAVMLTPERGRKRVVEAEMLLCVAVLSGRLLAHHANDCRVQSISNQVRSPSMRRRGCQLFVGNQQSLAPHVSFQLITDRLTQL